MINAVRAGRILARVLAAIAVLAIGTAVVYIPWTIAYRYGVSNWPDAYVPAAAIVGIIIVIPFFTRVTDTAAYLVLSEVLENE